MPNTSRIEVPNALAEAWNKLPPERRFSLVNYASFLAAQEDADRLHEVDEAVEKEWAALLNDERHTARFQRWAGESLANTKPELIDPSRL